MIFTRNEQSIAIAATVRNYVTVELISQCEITFTFYNANDLNRKYPA